MNISIWFFALPALLLAVAMIRHLWVLTLLAEINRRRYQGHYSAALELSKAVIRILNQNTALAGVAGLFFVLAVLAAALFGGGR